MVNAVRPVSSGPSAEESSPKRSVIGGPNARATTNSRNGSSIGPEAVGR
jgi:hypothetical protein